MFILRKKLGMFIVLIITLLSAFLIFFKTDLSEKLADSFLMNIFYENDSQTVSNSLKNENINDDPVFIYTPQDLDYRNGYSAMLEIQEKNQRQLLKKSVEIKLKKNGDHVDIILLNPEEIYIQAVRSWIAFPMDTLQINNFKINRKVFDFLAPGENVVDKKNGLIKIGLSSAKGISIKKFTIASFYFVKQTEDSVPLSCYDYGEETDSHCMVLGKERLNILKEVQGIFID